MWLLLFTLPAYVLSATVPNNDLCAPSSNVGVNMTSYSRSVAHHLHSISVEDIRYFFDDQFPINNTVPTINFDLTDTTPVLLFAPTRPSVFKFPAGAIVDYVLSNNDKTDKFGASGLTSLEEIVHHMHMLEMWNMASQVYKDIKQKNLNIKKVCPCLVNEQENGIIQYLTNMSQRFQNWIPAPIDGERKLPTGGSNERQYVAYVWGGKQYSVDGSPRTGRKIEGEMVRTIDGEEYQIVPELKDSTSWNSYWKAKVSMLESKEDQQQHSYNFAMYMYCKLNLA